MSSIAALFLDPETLVLGIALVLGFVAWHCGDDHRARRLTGLIAAWKGRPPADAPEPSRRRSRRGRRSRR